MAEPYKGVATKPLGAGPIEVSVPGSEGAGDPDMEAKTDAADRAFAAAEAGDRAGWADAVEDMVRICMAKYGRGRKAS